MPAIFRYALLSVPLIGAYSIMALGISVIYRASRVLNLAHGAMAMFCAYIAYTLTNAHVPVALAVLAAVLTGAVLGVGVERIFVRRLRPQGATAQTVGTVAVTGVLIAGVSKIWGSTPLTAPSPFGKGVVQLGSAGLKAGDVGLFFTGVVVSLALFAFFQRTQVGLAMRGTAQNRRAASLMGIDPDLAAAAAWALGGGLAALAGVLLAAVTSLDPYTLSLQALPAFVAVLIGGLESLPGALIGSVITGLMFGMVPYFSGTPVIGFVLGYSGAPQLALTILALVILATRGRRFSTADDAEGGLSSGGGLVGPRRRRRLAPMLVGGGVLLLFPFVASYSLTGTAILALEYSLVAASLVVLTGWVGQISLGQASFVGIAALITGMVTRGMGLAFPLSALFAAGSAALAAAILGVVALRVRGLYLAVATLIFAWMADSFLLPSPWLGAGSGSSTIPAQTFGIQGGFPFIDLTSRKSLYFVALAVVALVIAGLANLRDTRTGRAFFAVRGSETAAASVGIDVVRTKLVAFALSGALAGIAGNLIMLYQRTVSPTGFIFTVSLQYLAIAVVGGLGSLSGAVAAGVVFALLSQLFFQVQALSGWLEVVSAGLLAVILLLYPGGLAALGRTLSQTLRRLGAKVGLAERAPRPVDAGAGAAPAALPPPGLIGSGFSVVGRGLRAVGSGAARAASPLTRRIPAVRARQERRTRAGEDWYGDARQVRSNGHRETDAGAIRAMTTPRTDAELPPPPNGDGASSNALIALRPEGHVLPSDRSERRPLVETEDVTVQFGGLTAVKGVTMSVRDGEIVGLIGPNGAGKTTFFNSILGLNSPTKGTVKLYGYDVSDLDPHQRAQLGLARTFQVIQLFGELSVFENLLVATHLHNRSGLFSNMAATARTLVAENDARNRVREILSFLDLEEVADLGTRGLPFGVLRMVELGRALVTGSRLIMLDEPASGLNEGETDRLSHVITSVRDLGVSILLIEHDVRMVTGVSDYMYVLDQGALITEGVPADIQRDPKAIAAYLGGEVEEAVSP